MAQPCTATQNDAKCGRRASSCPLRLLGSRRGFLDPSEWGSGGNGRMENGVKSCFIPPKKIENGGICRGKNPIFYCKVPNRKFRVSCYRLFWTLSPLNRFANRYSRTNVGLPNVSIHENFSVRNTLDISAVAARIYVHTSARALPMYLQKDKLLIYK